MDKENRLPTYPVLSFLARHRIAVPLVAALLPLLIGLWCAHRSGLSDASVIGVVGAAVLWVVVRAALELIQLVVELLIPR